MISLLYVVLTGLLMLGGVLGKDGLVAVAILVMIALLGIWAIRSAIRRS